MEDDAFEKNDNGKPRFFIGATRECQVDRIRNYRSIEGAGGKIRIGQPARLRNSA